MQELRSWDILRAFYKTSSAAKTTDKNAESNETNRSFFDLRGLHGESCTCTSRRFVFHVFHLGHSTESTKQTLVSNHAARPDPRRHARHGVYSFRGHEA